MGEDTLLPSKEFMIVRGRPIWLLDKIGSALSILAKLIFLDWRFGNRRFSEESEDRLREFMTRQQLYATKVRINQYAPIDELRCLIANKRISWLLRYTFGIMNWLLYVLLPGRVFSSSDYYNPFAGTVHLFSDIPAIALHEVGHAYDFTKRRHPSLYCLTMLLPLAPLYHEFVASRHALRHLCETGNTDGQEEAWRILAPAYMTYVLGTFCPPDLTLVFLFPFVAIGHMYGGMKARRVRAAARAQEARQITIEQ